MNENILKYTDVNQWKNTAEVITWLTNIKSKKKSSLVNLDVENFYPSISIDLFTDAISYTKIITSIDDDQLSIIIQSRKTLIFNNIEPYVKKLGKKNLTLRWIVKIACGGLWAGRDIYFEQIKKCYKQREQWFISWWWIGNVSKYSLNQNRKKEKANC